METLYSIKHVKFVSLAGFVAGVALTCFITSKPVKVENLTQASVLPVKVETGNFEIPLKFRKILWDVLDDIEDPVRRELVGKYTRDLVALQEVDRFPVSVRLAQMMLEAGFSVHHPEGSELFQKGRNPFGIRYWRDYYPERITNWDDRVEGVVKIGNIEYMKFYSVQDAFKVHSDFVTKGHYAKHVTSNSVVPDYKEWVDALAVKPSKRFRYAEDPSYPSKLLKIIEENSLQELDILFLYD